MKKFISILLLIAMSVATFSTLTACKKEVYDIIYHIEEAVDEPTVVTYSLSRDNVSLWQPTEPQGYYFDGWYDNPSFNGVKIGVIPAGTKGHMEFYGRMVRLSGYTITYIIDGEEVDASSAKSYTLSNNAVTLWQPAPRDGYYFSEWYDNVAMEGSIVNSIPRNTIGDRIFYGMFVEGEPLIPYNITFIFNGVEQTSSPMKTYTKSYSPRTLWVPGNYDTSKYGFDGWYLDDTFAGEMYSEIPANTEGDLVYYARFREPDGWGTLYGRSKAPYFVVNYGTEDQIDSYTEYGKRPVLINFWSSECGPCRNEMPYFQNSYNQYGTQIRFMMVNALLMSDSPAKAESFIISGGYSFGWIYDDGKGGKPTVTSTFGVSSYTGIPVTVVLDIWGYIAFHKLGGVSQHEINNAILSVI